jgi:hypothetical protein
MQDINVRDLEPAHGNGRLLIARDDYMPLAKLQTTGLGLI